jgi:Bacterial Ig-like domain (group 2)
MLTGRKLALTLAFTVLIAVAAGISCRGFFVQPTLTSITVNPASPSVQLGESTTLTAYGVYSDGSGGYLSGGVSWSSSDDTVATISGTGSATLTGVSTGTSTITASAQSVTNTATATVFIAVSSMTISPSSQSISPLTGTTPLPFVVTVQPGSVDVSSSAVLTAYQNGVANTDITCTYSTSSPTGGSGGAGLYCSGDGTEPAGTYQLIATYTGTTITATATLSASQ